MTTETKHHPDCDVLNATYAADDWYSDENQEKHPGAYGIKQVKPETPNAMQCGTCGRCWLEDITPSGRCPWEYYHVNPEAYSCLSECRSWAETRGNLLSQLGRIKDLIEDVETNIRAAEYDETTAEVDTSLWNLSDRVMHTRQYFLEWSEL